MGITPWVKGQTAPALTATFQDDSGNIPNLSGATITLKLRERSTGSETAGAGAWTIVNGPGGLASYAWAAADVATAGTYDILVSVTASGKTTYYDPLPFVIISR